MSSNQQTINQFDGHWSNADPRCYTGPTMVIKGDKIILDYSAFPHIVQYMGSITFTDSKLKITIDECEMGSGVEAYSPTFVVETDYKLEYGTYDVDNYTPYNTKLTLTEYIFPHNEHITPEKTFGIIPQDITPEDKIFNRIYYCETAERRDNIRESLVRTCAEKGIPFIELSMDPTTVANTENDS